MNDARGSLLPWRGRPAGIPAGAGEIATSSHEQASFRDRFPQLFDAHFLAIFRYLDRLTGDRDLAADLAQETFVKLYQRGAMPDSPAAWLITVANNLFRNARNTAARRGRLLSGGRGRGGHGDPPPSPEHGLEAERARSRVRSALDRLTEREKSLLLLRAEGYSYRDLARALDLNEVSVGTLLARAKELFRLAYGEETDA